MMLDKIYADYAWEQAAALLAIDSPSGYTAKAAQWVKDAFAALGFEASITVKGGVLVDLGGKNAADGLLLEALETAPACRRHGYAAALVRAVMEVYGEKKIYSHVSKRNTPSLRVHEKCGFRRIAEHAVYADGSVMQNHVTFCSRV